MYDPRYVFFVYVLTTNAIAICDRSADPKRFSPKSGPCRRIVNTRNIILYVSLSTIVAQWILTVHRHAPLSTTTSAFAIVAQTNTIDIVER